MRRYADATKAVIKSSYTEIESGRRNDRPQLARALAHAKRSKATLVVAKLDRLSRNVAFLAALMDSGVDFVACDNPHANRLTLHILAALAEHEAKLIAQRTKEALAVTKSAGTPLGSSRPGHWEGYCRCPECDPEDAPRPDCTVCAGTGTTTLPRQEARLNGLAQARAASGKSLRKQATEAYSDLLPAVHALRGQGHSLTEIANTLTEQGHTTRRGKPWNAMQVLRLLRRADTRGDTR